MKNVFFALAFMLVGTFAFANNLDEAKLNVEETIEVSNNNEVNQIDYSSFKEMLQNGSIEQGEFINFFFKVKSVDYLDGCGNWWTVTYNDSEISDFNAFIIAGNAINQLTGC
ncbi:hypothetical protein [Lacinutrix mariniflava]|uniref:hypothetical protein n=1 Tax=Lacinutrix mariniflava TaxID=342955 RepID=UPI0006E181AE|nr:hypothetical protein [Lacinutrix mariniflava]